MSSRSPSARPACWPSRARGGGCPGSAPCSPWPASPPSSMARSPWPGEDPELCQYPAVPWPSPVDVRSEISDLPVERGLDLLSGLPPSDWYLRERLGRKAAAETACERFALRNYLREEVTEADAREALRRRRTNGHANGNG